VFQALLDRITASKSVFDRTKWAKEREAEEKYISLIRKDDTNGYLPQSAVGHSVFYKSLPIDSAATLPSPSRPATRSGYGFASSTRTGCVLTEFRQMQATSRASNNQHVNKKQRRASFAHHGRGWRSGKQFYLES
jgi:hypothetical protein